MDDETLARLARELRSFRTPWEDVAQREALIGSALPRIAATLDLLPPATATSHLLELGSAPFLGSQCLDVVWPGRVTHANYFGVSGDRGSQTLSEVGGTRTRTYEFDSFNVETDEFPYPDAAFDVVVFSELIEHLAINPVWALAEMHRVLRPDGHLIVTTPNALALERLDAVVRGHRPGVDRYSPAFGYGARHNREYTPWELTILLQETGFDIEHLTARDLETFSPAVRLGRALLRRLLRPFADASHRAHLFLRARRRPTFRWHFSDALFSNAALYQCVRHPWVEMGLNDAIQCEGAWDAVEALPDGGLGRRVRGRESAMPGASVLLRGVATARRVTVALRGDGGAGEECRGRVAVVARVPPHETLAFEPFSVRPGEWRTLELLLARPPADGEALIVNVAPESGHAVMVRRIALT